VEGEGSKRYVYVVKHGDLGKSKLERREIQVGIADSTNYEIVSGLQPGEMVALPGDVELKDGMAVRVMSTDSSNVKARQDEN
jgi:multidrug efflux pump subunit AcrA (membrane-fusion protein)